jgi:hypothetical protein
MHSIDFFVDTIHANRVSGLEKTLIYTGRRRAKNAAHCYTFASVLPDSPQDTSPQGSTPTESFLSGGVNTWKPAEFLWRC